MLLLSPGQKSKCGFCPCVPTSTPSKKKVQAIKKIFRSKGPNRMEKSQHVQGQEPDCFSKGDTAISFFCPSREQLLCVFYTYEQLAEHWRLVENQIIYLLNSKYSGNNHFCICPIGSFLVSCCNFHC